MSSCGWRETQTAASWGNVVPDLWIRKASLLPLTSHVVREGLGQRSKLSSQAGRGNEAVIDVGKQRGRALLSPSWGYTENVMLYNVHTHNADTHGTTKRTISFLEVNTSVSSEAFSTPDSSHTFSAKCPSIPLSAADANQRWQPKLTFLSVPSSFHLT